MNFGKKILFYIQTFNSFSFLRSILRYEVFQLSVGILMNRITWEIKQLIQEMEKRNIKCNLINNQNIFFNLTKEKDLESNDEIILERSLSYVRGLFSSAILESKGYKIINNHACLTLTGNKLLTTLKLIEKNIPTPETCVAFTEEASINAIEKKLNYPVVIKPIIGSWGRLIAKLDDYNSALSNLECREEMGNIWQKIYYLQKYIGEPEKDLKLPTDLRIIVIGNECVAAMGRYHPERDFRANLAIGGHAEPLELSEELKLLSIKASEAINGEIVGVDIMRDAGSYKVIEVNGTPQFKGISTATKINIASKIVDYLQEKYL